MNDNTYFRFKVTKLFFSFLSIFLNLILRFLFGLLQTTCFTCTREMIQL